MTRRVYFSTGGSDKTTKLFLFCIGLAENYYKNVKCTSTQLKQPHMLSGCEIGDNKYNTNHMNPKMRAHEILNLQEKLSHLEKECRLIFVSSYLTEITHLTNSEARNPQWYSSNDKITRVCFGFVQRFSDKALINRKQLIRSFRQNTYQYSMK